MIIIMYTIHKENGFDGVAFEFRRLGEPDKGTFVEKVLRDQVCANDKRLVGPPMNIVNASYGAHRNNVRVLNSKGYELSVFVAIQNFKGKTEGQVRQFARIFGTVIKQRIQSDPKSLNQIVVVAEENIHYSKDNVLMDFIGESNAMRLFRSVLPDFTNKSEYARSFFRDGSKVSESVALMKSGDLFMDPKHTPSVLKQQDATKNEENEKEAKDKRIPVSRCVRKYVSMGTNMDDNNAKDGIYEAKRTRLMTTLQTSIALKQQDAANKKQNKDKLYDKSITMYVTKYSTMGERKHDDIAYDAVYEAAREILTETLRSSPSTSRKEIEHNAITSEDGKDSK